MVHFHHRAAAFIQQPQTLANSKTLPINFDVGGAAAACLIDYVRMFTHFSHSNIHDTSSTVKPQFSGLGWSAAKGPLFWTALCTISSKWS